MHVLIAGGSGVLGAAVIPLLTAAGHRVTATTRSASKTQHLALIGAEPIILNAFDREGVRASVEGTRPDAIVSLLTDLNSGDSVSNARLRSSGTRHLADAALRVGIRRFVAESISWVYPSGHTPAAEADPVDPDTAEPRRTTISAVRDLEGAVGELDEAVVLRFGQLYGPGTWYSRDGRFGQQALANELHATETVASFIHTSDAARALLLGLEWTSGTWNIVDDEPAAGTAWAPHFAHSVGAQAPTASVAGNIGRPVSNARAHREGLVLQFPSWREGFLTP